MESNSTQSSISLISWDKVYRLNCEGGLGIRKMQDLNAALLTKLGWKVFTELDNLWVNVMSAKYLTKGNFLEVKKLANASTM